MAEIFLVTLPLTQVMVIFLTGAAITVDFGVAVATGEGDALGVVDAFVDGLEVGVADGLGDGVGVTAFVSASCVNFTRTSGDE